MKDEMGLDPDFIIVDKEELRQTILADKEF